MLGARAVRTFEVSKLLISALLLLSTLGCRLPSTKQPTVSPCPDIEVLENEAASVLGLVPPVNLVFVGCPAVVVGDPEFGLANPCDIVLQDAAGNEPRYSMLMILGDASHPRRALRISAAPLGSPRTEPSEAADRAVQILLGTWLIRTFTLDEIAELSLRGSVCAERNSPAWLAGLILGSLSNECEQVIEIIVCGA